MRTNLEHGWPRAAPASTFDKIIGYQAANDDTGDKEAKQGGSGQHAD
ncbi:hypothetical protein [Roseibium album]|nr:hypothetical protein [Labrenzia sp. EL_132]